MQVSEVSFSQTLAEIIKKLRIMIRSYSLTSAIDTIMAYPYVRQLYSAAVKCMFYLNSSFQNENHIIGRHHQILTFKKHINFIQRQKKELQEAKIYLFKENSVSLLIATPPTSMIKKIRGLRPHYLILSGKA